MTTADEKLCNTPMHIPSPLHSLLSSVRTLKPVDTLGQVIEGVKTYVFQHKLYDSGNPSFIKCDDDLSRALGVENFSVPNIKRILLRKLLAENKHKFSDLMAIAKGDASGKRKGAPPDDAVADDAVKKVRVANGFGKSEETSSEGEKNQMSDNEQSSSDDDCSSSSDTEKSLTDDPEKATFSGGILTVNEMYDIEYEVGNSSESSASFTDTESELEDIVSLAVLADLAASDSDEAFWADKSSDEGDISDVEIPSSDRWTCKTCGGRNKPPMRNCIKCFEERTGWFADREKNEMRESRRLQKKEKRRKKRDAISEAGPSGLSKANPEENPDEVSDLCMFCCSKRINSVIVHGKSGHPISCYKCARRVLSTSKRCPVCLRQIDRVIHLLSYR